MNENSEREKMIRIIIGSNERQFSSIHDLEESWIAQQINRRQAVGQDVCVRVFIKQKPVNVLLTTTACSKGIGRGPPPKQQENAIFDLWDECGLNKADFSGGNVIAFFKILRKLLD
jgi:hypothetical protein